MLLKLDTFCALLSDLVLDVSLLSDWMDSLLKNKAIEGCDKGHEKNDENE